jgi:mannose-6-phosphate isomerase
MRTEKPWGYEELWALNNNYAAKVIHINKNSRLSLQKHEEKHESIYVLSGILTLVVNEDTVILKEGQSITIPVKMVHRFCATDGDVRLIEVSTPELDDVVRIEDDYNRK